MLSRAQLAELKRAAVGPSGNRVSAAVAMAEVTLVQVQKGTGFAYSYVSDVSQGRHQTITVENARRFAEFFGCAIEDLFPPREAVA